MIGFQELLVCLCCGLILLVLMSGFIGSDLLYIELPLLDKVPFGLIIAVSISLYGCFGLIALGLGRIISDNFFLTLQSQIIIGICAIITSYFFGKIMMQMFQETPYQYFSDRAIGLTAKIRYAPQTIPPKKSGDASDRVLEREETTILVCLLVSFCLIGIKAV